MGIAGVVSHSVHCWWVALLHRAETHDMPMLDEYPHTSSARTHCWPNEQQAPVNLLAPALCRCNRRWLARMSG